MKSNWKREILMLHFYVISPLTIHTRNIVGNEKESRDMKNVFSNIINGIFRDVQRKLN